MLNHGTAGVAVGAFDGQTIEANGHIANALHHGARHAHVFAPRYHFRVVDVVEMVRGVAVVFHQEAGLAVLQQELDALVFVFGFAEARQLEDAPRLGAVALREAAAVKGSVTGPRAHDRTMRHRHVIRAVAGLQRNAGAGGEQGLRTRLFFHDAHNIPMV